MENKKLTRMKKVGPTRQRSNIDVRPMMFALTLALTAGPASGDRAASPEPRQNASTYPACVVLLHGLGRTLRSMDKMAQALQAAGYATANIDYPSRERPIQDLASMAVDDGVANCEWLSQGPIHFVTHSMGGILVRAYLSSQPVQPLGRVVMLSPPNQGSEAADALKDDALYAWYNGPAGQQLGTDEKSLPLRLGPVDFPLGVITGDQVAFFDGWLADAIPGPNDGKVSVARARVQGMSDFLVLPYAHSFIMQEPEVIEQTLHFLDHGYFRRDPESR